MCSIKFHLLHHLGLRYVKYNMSLLLHVKYLWIFFFLNLNSLFAQSLDFIHFYVKKNNILCMFKFLFKQRSTSIISYITCSYIVFRGILNILVCLYLSPFPRHIWRLSSSSKTKQKVYKELSVIHVYSSKCNFCLINHFDYIFSKHNINVICFRDMLIFA